MQKAPDSTAIAEWLKVSSRELALRWHLKWTPWFSPLECAKIVNLYDESKFKTELKIDELTNDFDKLLLQSKIASTYNG